MLAASAAAVISIAQHGAHGGRTDSLVQVVILSRHGMKNQYRSNLQYHSVPLAAYAPGKHFANFSVRPGDLTPHGARVLREMGSYLREVYEPLLVSYPPLSPSSSLSEVAGARASRVHLAAVADPACNRDVLSADAVLGGWLGDMTGDTSNSGVSAFLSHLIDARPMQPLSAIFRDEPSKIDRSNGCVGANRQQVGGLFGGSGSSRSSHALSKAYHRQISAVNHLLGCCHSEVCEKLGSERWKRKTRKRKYLQKQSHVTTGDRSNCSLFDIEEQWNNASAWRAYRGKI